MNCLAHSCLIMMENFLNSKKERNDDMNLENEIMPLSGVGTEVDFDYALAPSYVADAFTKTEDKVNLEVDNASINCLTSKNNKFSLDEEGNLTVNSFTCNNANFSVLSAYPIGSIYLSVNNTNPSSLFGGVWEAWGTGKCLVGVDATQVEFNAVEKTGGEKEHTLTVEEMPTHTHEIGSSGAHTHTYTGFLKITLSNSSYEAIAHKRYTADGTKVPPSMNSSGGHTHTPANTGEGQAHNNLQPYITCYMWKRVA